MQKERITISVDPAIAQRVRLCAARSGSGGASAYLERLVRADQLQEAATAMGRWYSSNPSYSEASEAERVALAEEPGRSA